MDQAKLEALLGRSLTTEEVASLDTYLKLANESVEQMLCVSLSCDSDERVYEAREGYRTLFTDIFTEIYEVTVDDEIVDASKYSMRQWEKRNGKWYNSLVFTTPFTESVEVTVSADWGFRTMPSDLQILLARMFDLITRQNKFDREINTKKVEDFTISYNHSDITMSDTLMESFMKDNAMTINKYSQCRVGNVQHGSIC